MNRQHFPPAAEAVIRLQRIDLARQHHATARQRNEFAGVEMAYWELRQQIAKWESRTGLDHTALLKNGLLVDPLGQGTLAQET